VSGRVYITAVCFYIGEFRVEYMYVPIL